MHLSFRRHPASSANHAAEAGSGERSGLSKTVPWTRGSICLLTVLGSALFLGCTTTATRQPPPPSSLEVSDSELSSRVSRALFEASLPSVHLIEIETQGGTVTLTAHGEAQAQLANAAAVARRVEGVHEVITRIGPEAP